LIVAVGVPGMALNHYGGCVELPEFRWRIAPFGWTGNHERMQESRYAGDYFCRDFGTLAASLAWKKSPSLCCLLAEQAGLWAVEKQMS